MDARLYLLVSCAEVDVVAAALAGGVDIVQLRDKDADDAAFLAAARRLREICAAVPLILNDRARLVADAGADGVHVGEDDAPPEDVRALLGPGAIVGISTHDRAEVGAAAGRGASYVGLGPMFPTGTKRLTRTPQGAALVRAVAGATDLPVFPIGGITAARLPQLVEAGATRVAVSSAICRAQDPREAAADLRTLLP
jgi:thiamine-phosphate pyrophosphorylase